jgi:hypothetical protein
VAGRGIGHDVVQGGSESLEQERVAVEVVAKQARTAIAVGEAQSGGLEAEVPTSARHTDLENGRCPVRERRLDDERGVAPCSVAPMVNDQSRATNSTTDGSSLSHAAFPSAATLFRTSSGTLSLTRLVVVRAVPGGRSIGIDEALSETRSQSATDSAYRVRV